MRDYLRRGNRTQQIFHPSLLPATIPFQITPKALASSGVSRAGLANSNHNWIYMAMQTCSESMGYNGSRDLHRRDKAMARNCDP